MNLWSLPQTNVVKVKNKRKRWRESQYWEVLQIVIKFAFIRLFKKKALIRFCWAYSLTIVNNSAFDFSFGITSIGTIAIEFDQFDLILKSIFTVYILWKHSTKRSAGKLGNNLRGRRLKGKGKGILGARETQGAREEGGKETPSSRPLYFSFFSF